MSETETRQLHGHHVDGSRGRLEIRVLDDPGAGGACHAYDIIGFDTESNPSSVDGAGYRRSFIRLCVVFQNGPIGEHGTNGITHEALLAILIDRMEGFQSGDFRCRENAIALTKLQEVQMWLQKRTRDRVSRGVEGTHEQ